MAQQQNPSKVAWLNLPLDWIYNEEDIQPQYTHLNSV